MAKVISGQSAISKGTISGSWNQGLSAYDLAVRYQGFKGTVLQWLETLKAFSPVVGEIEQTEDGIKFILTDEKGDHEISLRNGIDIEITDVQLTEEGETLVTFSDGTTITIPKGEQGVPGRDPIFVTDRDGVIWWRYSEGDNNLKQVIDLGGLATQRFRDEFNSHQFIQIVDELPSPEDAEEGVMYILREEVMG